MKFFLQILFFLTSVVCVAQQQSGTLARKYFNKGNDAMESGDFVRADSLYLISIEYGGFAETYFNKALVNLRLDRREIFCENMGYAAVYGDTLAMRIYLDSCGIKSTVCYDSLWRPTFDTICKYRMFIEGAPFLKRFFFAVVNHVNDTVEYYMVYDKRDTMRFATRSYRPARFPGGYEQYNKYFYEKMYYPIEARKRGIMGTVYVWFNVSDEGGIYNIHTDDNVPFLTEEALRFVRTLPRFEPAKLYGYPVKSTYCLPISFRLYSIRYVD